MDRHRPRCEDNIKTDLKWDNVGRIRLFQVMGKCWAGVTRVTYLAFHITEGGDYLFE
jgi:hypothetical protein